MLAYCPPLDDYHFLLNDVLKFDSAMAELGIDVDADLALTVLGEGGRLCSERLHPLNRSGDEHGARLVDGQAQMPPGFAEAHRVFVEGGWPSLSADPAHGGQGLPFIVQLWMDEMLSSANISFALNPGLTRGACEAIAAHADDALKSQWLPQMVSGEWTGAMALTESGAGTDLSLIQTKAVANADGSYSISGAKMFISFGDNDLGTNVIHLVLARTPEAPSGVKGISLFLVPKFMPDAGGAYTVRNAMSVGALEAKMGLHAKPTCVINYDGATGWLVGELHQGVAAMFTMMNSERLMVGVHGLGLGAAAYQQAAGYAKERLQGRSADRTRALVPIIEHADVQRMLLTIRSYVEGGRALAGWTALQLDRSRAHPDPKVRNEAAAFVALLTPVIKASFTDFGFETAVLAQQIFGGHGYVREWGAEQFVRDARAGQIYEGTNGIQALDLVGRKLAMDNGDAAEALFRLVEAELRAAADSEHAMVLSKSALEALALLRDATRSVCEASDEVAGAVAVDYLRMFALVVLGWMWARMASSAHSESALHKAKRSVADYFSARVLTRIHGLHAGILAGVRTPITMDVEAF